MSWKFYNTLGKIAIFYQSHSVVFFHFAFLRVGIFQKLTICPHVIWAQCKIGTPHFLARQRFLFEINILLLGPFSLRILSRMCKTLHLMQTSWPVLIWPNDVRSLSGALCMCVWERERRERERWNCRKNVSVCVRVKMRVHAWGWVGEWVIVCESLLWKFPYPSISIERVLQKKSVSFHAYV